MSEYKVVVTDYEYSTLQYEEEVVTNAGATLVPAQCKTEDDLIAVCKDAHGLLNQYAPITRRVIEKLDNCKVIARYGVGVNTVDLEAATEKGICVVNVPDYCVDEVSDHAFALLLACARKVVQLNNSIKAGTWDYKISRPIYRLRGRKLGIVGFGRIPRALAEKARPFGFELLIYDPFLTQTDVDPYGAALVGLDELMANSDFVSVHAPLTPETHHLVGEKELSLMKSSAFILNTSRGPVIDEKALIKALQDGLIAGAGLDVLEEEPASQDNPLLGMDNVIINPHVAWYSEQAEIELKTKAAQGVAEVLQGFFPKNLVNKQVKTKLDLKELL
ncbi:C-terminal binding protein [Desulfosporosinus burensis]